MIRAIRSLLFVLLISLNPGPAPAQQPVASTDATGQRLDSVRASLDQIEQTLTRSDLGDQTLQELRSGFDPQRKALLAIIEEASSQVAAIRARLDQLGRKPGDKDPPEPQNVSDERKHQQEQFDDLDARLKRARLLSVRLDQLDSTIIDRRRQLFAKALFSRSYSILSPTLWVNAAQELPRDFRAAVTMTSDWLSLVDRRISGAGLVLLILGLLAIAAAAVVATLAAERVTSRDPSNHDPSPFLKAIGAVWTVIVTAVVPLAVMLALNELMKAFDLAIPRFEPLGTALFEGVVRVAMTIGVARALLAPGLVNWRMLNVTEQTVDRLMRLAVTIALVVSVTRLFEAAAAVIAASLPVSVALRGLGSAAVAMVLAANLYGAAGQAAGDEECLGPPIMTTGRDWYVTMRFAAWLVHSLIALSVLAGYIAFAAFVVDQLVWVTFVGASLFLLTQATHESIDVGLQSQTAMGRLLIHSVGLRRQSLELMTIVLSGLAHLALVLIAIMLVLAPWGVASTDIVASVRAAIFGFQVGDVSISLASVIVAILLFAIGLGATRALQRWLSVSFLPKTELDSGLQNSIRTSVGYLGFVCAAGLALTYVGLNFERVAIVAGALSVGIGFGLNSIVNNFVSGLIILWERTIRVGDWVVVGTDQGYVRRINIRSTEIETFDRAMVIMPNSALVTGAFKNWVRGDKVGRIKVPVIVNTGVDPEKVRDVLIDVARSHDMVLKLPSPLVFFTALATNGISFDLICFVADVETSSRIASDLNFAIFRRFREAGFELMATGALPPVASITGLEHLLPFVRRYGESPAVAHPVGTTEPRRDGP